MTDDRAETPLLADRVTLTDVIAAAIEGHRDGYEPADLPTEYHGYGYACADALLASAAVQTPGQYVAGLADDETLVERMVRVMYDGLDGPPPPREARVLIEASIEDVLRALAAALTERTDHG